MPTAPAEPRIALATKEQATQFIARFPNAEDAVRRLLTDQRKLRIRLRSSGDVNAPPNETITRLVADHADEVSEMERALEEATTRIPKDGSVVVPKADADELAEWRKIQLVTGTPAKPAEVAERVKKAGELEGTVASTELEKTARTAAAALQWPGVDALVSIAKDKGLAFELRDETVDGKTVKVPYVKVAAEKDAQFVKLAEFAEKHLAPYLPAFKTAPAVTSADSSTPHGGTLFTPQVPVSSTAPSGNIADKFLADRNKKAAERPNPLRPATVAQTTK